MKFMSTEELAVWNALLDSTNSLPGSTGERGAALIEALAEHEQAHHRWAAMALDKLANDGAQKALTSRARSQSKIVVAFSTADAMRSSRIGVRQKDGSFQQKLFKEVTWAELQAHIDMVAGQLQSLGMTIAVDRKVMKLREKFPKSVGPADACKQLGVSVDEFIGAAA